MSAAQQAALLNEVVYPHRSEGWGLEKKDGGNTCPQPTTGIRIACDILRFGNLGMDVLNDAEGAGIPTWGGFGPATGASFVAPVDPGVVLLPPPVDPPVDPPPPTPDAQLEELKRQTFWLEKIAGRQAETNAQLKALRVELAKGLADLRAAIAAGIKVRF